MVGAAVAVYIGFGEVTTKCVVNDIAPVGFDEFDHLLRALS